MPVIYVDLQYEYLIYGGGFLEAITTEVNFSWRLLKTTSSRNPIQHDANIKLITYIHIKSDEDKCCIKAVELDVIYSSVDENVSFEIIYVPKYSLQVHISILKHIFREQISKVVA